MDISNYIYIIVAWGTIPSRKIGECCPIRKNNSSSAARYNSIAGICNRCPPPHPIQGLALSWNQKSWGQHSYTGVSMTIYNLCSWNYYYYAIQLSYWVSFIFTIWPHRKVVFYSQLLIFSLDKFDKTITLGKTINDDYRNCSDMGEILL